MTRKGLKNINTGSRIIFLVQTMCAIVSIFLLLSGLNPHLGVIFLFVVGVVYIFYGVITYSLAWWTFFEKEADYSSVIHKDGRGIKQVFVEFFIYRNKKKMSDSVVITFCRMHWMTIGVFLFHFFSVIVIFMIMYPEMS